MENIPFSETKTLSEILSAITYALSEQEYADIADYIASGESGLATDTIFYAISEDHIEVDDQTIDNLSSLHGLFNMFGDADPEVARRVLSRSSGAMQAS